MGRAMAGDGVAFTDAPSEGKVTFTAGRDGLLIVDEERLMHFNRVPDVMRKQAELFDSFHRRQDWRDTPPRSTLPGTPSTGPWLCQGDKPIFSVLPLRKPRAGILVTGTEVYEGLVKDGFVPVMRKKRWSAWAPRPFTRASSPTPGRHRRRGRGTDRGGDRPARHDRGCRWTPTMSPAMDWKTPGRRTCSYSAPILPGAMTLIARIGEVQVIGVLAAALYYKTTSFDLLIPRLLAGLTISRHPRADGERRLRSSNVRTVRFPCARSVDRDVGTPATPRCRQVPQPLLH